MKRTSTINSNRSAAPRHHQRGITLLESLVSILVLAVAVLGMLGVQLRTLAETQTSVKRAQAVRLIEDFSERIKSNPGDFGQLDAYVSGWASVPSGNDCKTASCTPTELAAWDVQEWKQSVTDTMPGAKANVFVSGTDTDMGNRRQLGVLIGWNANERNTTAGDTNYLTPFAIDTGSGGVTCPVGLICHLVYVQP